MTTRDFALNGVRKFSHRDDVVALIIDRAAATKINVMQLNSARRQVVNQRQQTTQSINVWRELRDLRTDVTFDAVYLNTLHARSKRVETHRVGVRHAKLVRLEACGNVRMRFCVNVRIDPKSDSRALAIRDCDLVYTVELSFGFDVEAKDVVRERERNLVMAFTYARENHFAGITAGRDNALQFTAGNNVESRALGGQQGQYAQR